MRINDEIPIGEEEIIPVFCSHHCASSCFLKAYVRDGVVTHIESDTGEPPQVRACARGRAYRQRLYSPDRLKSPMKRVGERGDGAFEEISWDEALDTVAGEIKRIGDTYGPESIIVPISIGDSNNLHGPAAITRVLSLAGGYTGTWGFWSFEQSQFAQLASFGTSFNRNSPESFLNAKLIILWGCNPAVVSYENGFTGYLKQAKEAGIRIVSIDPRYSRSSAVLADQWIPIIPATDTAMVIAMAYVIMKENLQDQTYLDTYTVGFDRYRDYVLGIEDNVPKTPGWAEAITGVPAATTEALAEEYAAARPSALIAGIVPGRTPYGEQFGRATITLSAMMGNIGVLGGEVSANAWPGTHHTRMPRGGKGTLPYAPNPAQDVPSFAYHRINNFPDVSSDRVGLNTHVIADAILRGKAGGYPTDYRMLFCLNTNYLNQDANTNRIVKAFKSLEFAVTVDQFMTATARHCDIVLPTCTMLERNAIGTAMEQTFIAYSGKAVETIGESRSHLDIGAGLAEKLGITDFNDKTEDQLLRQSMAHFEGYRDEEGKPFPDYETFKKEGIVKFRDTEPFVAFQAQIEDLENHPFNTPSGKIEIYSEKIAQLNDPGLPPIPKYIEAWEGRNDPLAEKYPLQLLSTHSIIRAHSQFDNIPWLRELQEQSVLMNANDAQARGISEGDKVHIFNDRGEMIIPAKLSQRIMPGVVDVKQGAWFAPDENGVDRGGAPNVLTRDATSPGGGFVTSSCLVQVEKARERMPRSRPVSL